MNTSSAAASNRTCATAPRAPSTRPMRSRTRTAGSALRRSKRGLGQSSSATPVNAAATAAIGNLRAPAPGSWILMWRLPTRSSTTKCVKRQWSMQGNLSRPRSPISRRTARVASSSRPAKSINDVSVVPFAETAKRRRSVATSTRCPWKDAIIARHAMPHSAASVCNSTGSFARRPSARLSTSRMRRCDPRELEVAPKSSRSQHE